MVDGGGQVGQAAPAVGRRRVRVDPRRRDARRAVSPPTTTISPADDCRRRPPCGLRASARRSATRARRRTSSVDPAVISPTRLAAAVHHRHRAELVAEAEEAGERRPQRAHAAVLDLQRDADARPATRRRSVPRRRPSRSSPGAGASGRCRSRPARSRSARGARSSRRRSRPPPWSSGEARERVRHPLEGHPEGEDAAAVDRGRDLVARQLGRAATSSRSSCCIGWPSQPVALDRPPAGAADGEEARVLAGAVVREQARPAALLGAELEVGLGRRRRRRAGCAPPRAAAGSARCDAQAIASSTSVTSSRSRASGSAWIGFDEER